MIEKEVAHLKTSKIEQKSLYFYLMNNLNLFRWNSIEKFKHFYQGCGVYGLVFPEETAIYVGKTNYFYRRLTQHFKDLSKGYHWNSRVAKMVGKTQKFPKIAILEETTVYEQRERFWIAKFKEDNWNMLNIR